MRVKQAADNGNVATANRNDNNSPHRSSNIKNWLISNNTNTQNTYENIKRVDILRFNSNSNIIYNNSVTDSTKLFQNNELSKEIKEPEDTSNVNVELGVCNRQYRLNAENNINFLKSCNNTATANLEGATESFLAPCESFLGDGNVSSNTTPIDEERAFDHSDTDEMSENAIRPVPRGIVNPNYPGFQHLAHTLQDYSSNIENFYHSENDMTDDDIDIEITESTYETESDQNRISLQCRTINNNNINDSTIHSNIESTNDCIIKTETIDSDIQNEIPDLLKTITTTNNNIETIGFDINCSDTDIENNFNTKDIIGDFNKEIEDEIKQLLNYNINIQEDLEELRKDIKDTFAKPIENTINNISEVVNHVIKKLVETHSDETEQSDNNIPESTVISQADADETSNIIKENDSNTRTEMNLSRPTFLFIENNTNNKITDAFLSDGKDEINIYDNDYDTEHLSNNVENTIKQLSTELRKIIPKLDEMRERDRLWNDTKKEYDTVITDGNSNEIASSSKCYNYVVAGNPQLKNELSKDIGIVDTKHLVKRNETRSPRDRQNESVSVKNCSRNRSNTSVRKNENIEDCELESFDVYNIETALPKLDFDAIENHLKAAKEAERRKRNDREEIRRRLAMGADSEEYYSMGHTDRPGKKPSLHSRLQNGMNLQICFMNETASDNESQASDVERNTNYNDRNLSHSSIFSKSNYSLNNHPYQTRPLSVSITKHDKISTVQSGAKLRPSSLTLKSSKTRSSQSMGHIELKESDFYALQATLQTEARIALAQAKEMARIQMERERRSRAVSPVTEMLRRSMQKANAPLAPDRRRVSRQLLTDMNIAQLQVIVNELHSQIESLNDTLVKMLMARDELHMGQDSMLVDIEDLTRYLGVKEQTKKTKGSAKGVRRLTSLVHK